METLTAGNKGLFHSTLKAIKEKDQMKELGAFLSKDLEEFERKYLKSALPLPADPSSDETEEEEDTPEEKELKFLGN